MIEHEPELRTQLRLSLEPNANPEMTPLRKGRVIGWLHDALAPLENQMAEPDLHRLVLAIRATTGIESLIWLTDMAGLSSQDAVEIMRSSARTLLRSALSELS